MREPGREKKMYAVRALVQRRPALAAEANSIKASGTDRKSLRTPADLVAAGLAPTSKLSALETVAERYAVAITPAIAAIIDPNDPNDPIAHQFVPDAAELETSPHERADPIGDDLHSPVEGLVHRHADRVLLKLVHVCPVYCRFCFRRAMVGPRGRPTLSPKKLAAAIDYIRAHPKIWEVILTGGDPLILSPRKLQDVLHALADIDHVRIIRMHSRMPVAAPKQITPDLVRAIKASGRATYVVLHANHPRELTAAAKSACARFVDAGIPMLSQSVLLKGVNDDPETFGALMRAFVETRIKPYYLHHADLAPGTAHLRTNIAEGQALMRSLRARWSGLCQPAYMLDIPGGAGKVPIGPNYLAPRVADCESGRHQVEDLDGRLVSYPPAEG